MLTIFRRHTRKCTHRSKGRAYKYCPCPIAVEDTLDSEYIRQSLDTRNWETAQTKVRRMEAPDKQEPVPSESITVQQAVEQFFEYMRTSTRKRVKATLDKYDVLLNKQLIPFARTKGVSSISEFSMEYVRLFRSTWKDGPLSAYKKNERLRTFFKHFKKLIDENPAEKLETPKTQSKIKFFSADELKAIVAACDRYDTRGKYGPANRERVRAFVLVLRYTGLRIGDVVTLQRDKVSNDAIYLRAAKNNQPVWLPLHPDVAKALEGLPAKANGPYYFWTGNVSYSPNFGPDIKV
jgi:integrase/recombinase XerD